MTANSALQDLFFSVQIHRQDPGRLLHLGSAQHDRVGGPDEDALRGQRQGQGQDGLRSGQLSVAHYLRGAQHSTGVAFVLPTQLLRVRISHLTADPHPPIPPLAADAPPVLSCHIN